MKTGTHRCQQKEEESFCIAIPPHDLDAEAVVLSDILLEDRALDSITFLLPEHFYSTANRRIYEACLALDAAAQRIDAVLVATWLRDHDHLAEVGGIAYIARTVDSVPAVANLAAHARVIVEKWKAREVIRIGQRLVAEAHEPVEDLPTWLRGAAAEFLAIGAEDVSPQVVVRQRLRALAGKVEEMEEAETVREIVAIADGVATRVEEEMR